MEAEIKVKNKDRTNRGLPLIKKIKSNRKMNKEKRTGMLFLLPGFVGMAIFYFIPIFMMIYYSFLDNSEGIFGLGLGNYKEVYTNGVFQKALLNTMVFTVLSVAGITILSLGLALLLREMTFYKSVIQSVILTPLVVPTASIIMVWRMLFENSGLINTTLAPLLSGQGGHIDFLNSGWSLLTILLFYYWKNIGYNVIILLAAIENVNGDQYEAADLDGANAWQQLRYITIPAIMPSLIFIMTISTLNAFKSFREIYLLFGAYPNQSIYSMQHYMNNLFTVMDFQKLSVAAVTMMVIVALVTNVFLKIDKHY